MNTFQQQYDKYITEKVFKPFLIIGQYVGSQVTVNPAPPEQMSDVDFLGLTDEERATALFDFLFADGFQAEGSEVEDPADSKTKGYFQSFRKGALNLIITGDKEFYCRFIAATSVAKHLNLRYKPDRIVLFQAVLYGNQFDKGLYESHVWRGWARGH